MVCMPVEMGIGVSISMTGVAEVSWVCVAVIVSYNGFFNYMVYT